MWGLGLRPNPGNKHCWRIGTSGLMALWKDKHWLKVDYTKVSHTCLRHLRNYLEHNAFGNNLEAEARQAHTLHARFQLSFSALWGPLPDETGRTVAVNPEMALLLCSLCGHSHNSKIFGREPRCTNEALNYRFLHPGRKKMQVSPHISPCFLDLV